MLRHYDFIIIIFSLLLLLIGLLNARNICITTRISIYGYQSSEVRLSFLQIDHRMHYVAVSYNLTKLFFILLLLYICYLVFNKYFEYTTVTALSLQISVYFHTLDIFTYYIHVFVLNITKL